MQSRTARNLAIAMILVALVLGLFALRLVRDLRPAPAPAAANVPSALPRVVVAVETLERGRPVDLDALSLEEVAIVPEGAFRKIEDVAGRRLYLAVGQGEPLLSRHFRPPGPVASRIQPGERAIAVKVDGVIGLGGFIQPDDRVDVLLYLARDQREIADTQARVLLEDVRVLAFGSNLERREVVDGDDATSPARTAVLAVPEADIDLLMLGASKGNLRLALRGDPVEEGSAALSPVAASHAKDPRFETLATLLGATSGKKVAHTGAPARPLPRVHRGRGEEISRY